VSARVWTAIERLADAAWPAGENVPLGDWVLRATQGVTRRANSVFTAGGRDYRGHELEQLIAEAEGFYLKRSLRPVFQISDATGARELDATLERRGYSVGGRSEVWTAIPGEVRRAAAVAGGAITSSDEVTPAWFDCAFADDAADQRPVHEQIVSRVPKPRRFASAVIDGEVGGCGMAASSGGFAGLFCMVTRPAVRRRGVGSILVRHLCEWAAGRGDATVFLQVMVDNEAAKGLYAKAGFARAYGYHYRLK
jgi:ribosomal protein S18 acetylase RimI-like enzyme